MRFGEKERTEIKNYVYEKKSLIKLIEKEYNTCKNEINNYNEECIYYFESQTYDFK